MGVLFRETSSPTKSFFIGYPLCVYLHKRVDWLIALSSRILLRLPICYCIENRLRAVAFARVELLIIKRTMCIYIVLFLPSHCLGFGNKSTFWQCYSYLVCNEYDLRADYTNINQREPLYNIYLYLCFNLFILPTFSISSS